MRSALAAALVVAAASVLTGVALVIAAHYILLDNINQNATQRADQIAAQLSVGGPSALPAAIHPSPRDRTVVQVVDADGHVLAASTAFRGVTTISSRSWRKP
jgi:hypothetical protein